MVAQNCWSPNKRAERVRATTSRTPQCHSWRDYDRNRFRNASERASRNYEKELAMELRELLEEIREQPPGESSECPALAPVSDPLLSTIGDTMMLPYDDPQVDGSIQIKCEFDNPTGSMKDRIAYGMIAHQILQGELSKDDPIVEGSSGNTGGAVAMVANRLGYDAVITTPEGNSSQKLGYITAYGAELVTCPNVPSDNDRYYRAEAKRIADERGGVWLDQYTNQLNPRVHRHWTGPEITEQCPEVTHIVSPMGTGGTMSGIARHAKQCDESITTVGVDAEKSNISAAFHKQELGEYDTAVEGLGKDSELPTMWFDYVDEVRNVSDKDAFKQAREAARDHGTLVGGSAGAALSAARNIAQDDPDNTVVVVACDGGEQYFDTLFNEEWLATNGVRND